MILIFDSDQRFVKLLQNQSPEASHAASVNYFAVVVVATNKTWGAFP